jgi:hypothetical protein
MAERAVIDTRRGVVLPDVTATALTGAPDTIGRLGSEVEVVLDFLWGDPAAEAMAALVAGRTDPIHPLTWVNLGEMPARRPHCPAGALRSSGLRFIACSRLPLHLRQPRYCRRWRCMVGAVGGAFRAGAGTVWDVVGGRWFRWRPAAPGWKWALG